MTGGPSRFSLTARIPPHLQDVLTASVHDTDSHVDLTVLADSDQLVWVLQQDDVRRVLRILIFWTFLPITIRSAISHQPSDLSQETTDAKKQASEHTKATISKQKQARSNPNINQRGRATKRQQQRQCQQEVVVTAPGKCYL